MADTSKPTDEREERIEEAPEKSESNGAGGGESELSDQKLQERLEAQRSGLKTVGSEGEEPRAGSTAVAAARDGRKLTDGEKSSALNWFLNEDPRAADEETKHLELNFGTQDEPNYIDWTIKPVPMEVMRAVRRKAANTRLARTTGEVDEYRVNLEIVVEGTLDPDIRAAAQQLAEEGRGPGDPVDALRAKFQSKPGYIAQLAGQIMTLSGFNDEDVREAEKAAKN
jgi:hypothetical protein